MLQLFFFKETVIPTGHVQSSNDLNATEAIFFIYLPIISSPIMYKYKLKYLVIINLPKMRTVKLTFAKGTIPSNQLHQNYSD